MKTVKKALLLILLFSFAVTSAIADKLRLPADAPPAFQAECGSCHGAFSPQLMIADDWFQREHRKVSAADWKDAKVKTPANCAACHTQAAEGSYREREIVMPDGRRWKG